MSRLESCPRCLTEVHGWASACPKCRYHPDFYNNRALDDVATIFHLGESDCAARCAAPSGSTSWLSWLPWWSDKHPPRPTA